MNGTRRRIASALAALLALAVPGCASKPPPTVVRITLDAGANVNPDAQGRPSPVVVRVYELKGLALFESSDYFALFERDRETLGGELLRTDEFALSPRERKSVERTVEESTRYIGVVAGFRDLERARWRASLAITPHATTSAVIVLDGTTVTIRRQ